MTSLKTYLAVLATFCVLGACGSNVAHLPEVPVGAQAVSLTGTPLYSPEPPQEVLDRMRVAREAYESDPENVDNVIWLGRRTAYTGDYRGAIKIFSDGIEKFPTDARLYRHRGHRYITIREFDRAIADLERAAELIEGTENEVEPDGLPNALNIPVSTLHGNIWYHLGLAYYLRQDWADAARAFRRGFDTSTNDDNRVSTAHWLYMIERRRGDSLAAAQIVDAISADLSIIENMSYHRLCLFYKGELTAAELVGDNGGTPAGAAVDYGLANWHFYNGHVEEATSMLVALSQSAGWSAFGVIAAEADLAAVR